MSYHSTISNKAHISSAYPRVGRIYHAMLNTQQVQSLFGRLCGLSRN